MPERFIDNFSSQSMQYSFSRPRYPELLFEFLYTVTSQKKLPGIVQLEMDKRLLASANTLIK